MELDGSWDYNPEFSDSTSQACKDPSHNYLHQPHHQLKWIWKFLKFIYFTKILVVPILFCWLQFMHQSHDPINEVFICHHFIKWIADTKKEYHHWILPTWISLSTKFQPKQIILTFWRKFVQDRYFLSKSEKRTPPLNYGNPNQS